MCQAVGHSHIHVKLLSWRAQTIASDTAKEPIRSDRCLRGAHFQQLIVGERGYLEHQIKATEHMLPVLKALNIQVQVKPTHVLQHKSPKGIACSMQSLSAGRLKMPHCRAGSEFM